MKNVFIVIGIVVILAVVFLFFLGRNGEDIPEDVEEITFASVNLYYPNSEVADEIGDVCSPESVIAIEREIPSTISPIRDTIELLIQGELTEEEIEDGFSTEFPDNGFSLEGVNLSEGILTLEFNDENNFSTGGSCSVGLLSAQVFKTAMQFDEVNEVRIIPEDELFQP